MHTSERLRVVLRTVSAIRAELSRSDIGTERRTVLRERLERLALEIRSLPL